MLHSLINVFWEGHVRQAGVYLKKETAKLIHTHTHTHARARAGVRLNGL